MTLHKESRKTVEETHLAFTSLKSNPVVFVTDQAKDKNYADEAFFVFVFFKGLFCPGEPSFVNK